MISSRLDNAIRNVPDFPKPGILFKDITPVFKDAALCKEMIEHLAKQVSVHQPDAIIGIESRGFFFGFAIAQQLGIPFIPVRKAGKLPYTTHKVEYALEYGTASIEMNIDALNPGWKVVIHDDLLATGGTALAAAELVRLQQAEVAAFSFVVDLSFLNGLEKISTVSRNIYSLIRY